MATLTPKLGLRKPAGSDLVTVSTDVDANMDAIDLAYGAKARFKRTSGSYAVNSTAWASLDTYGAASASDLVLKAVAGDWIEVGFSFAWDNQAMFGVLDVVSTIAGVLQSVWGATQSATDSGIVGCTGVASAFTYVGGGYMKQCAAGDIDGTGNLTLRVKVRINAAGSKNLFATVDNPFTWWAKNNGQP